MTLNVLVFEPQPCRGHLLRSLLQGDGHRVSQVGAVEEAAARLETGLFDAVVFSGIGAIDSMKALSEVPTPCGGAVVVHGGELLHVRNDGAPVETVPWSLEGLLSLVRRIDGELKREAATVEARICGDGFAVPCRLFALSDRAMWLERAPDGAEAFHELFARAGGPIRATLEMPQGRMAVSLQVRFAERSPAAEIVRVAASVE